MPTTLTSESSTDAHSRPSSVVHRPGPKRDSGNAETFTIQTLFKPSAARHSASFLDHVNSMNQLWVGSNDGSTGVTPDPDDRRDGLTWGAQRDHEDTKTTVHLRRTTIHEPKGTSHPSPQEGDKIMTGSSAKADATQPGPSLKGSSTSYLEHTISREDTSRSSISSIGRGPRRAMPDIKMFDPRRVDEKHETEEPSQRPITKNRSLSFRLAPALRKSATGERSPKHTKFSYDHHGHSKKPSNTLTKGGLKDRRGLKHTEALKLTLPPKVSDSHPQGRGPALDPIKLAYTPQPRQRSPKTPQILHTADERDTIDNTVTDNAIIHSIPANNVHSRGISEGSNQTKTRIVPTGRKSHDKCYITMPRRSGSRSGSGRSDNSVPRPLEREASTLGEQIVNPIVERTEELKQLGAKQSKRWRWSGPSTSNDLTESNSPTPRSFDRQSRFLGFFKKRVAMANKSPITASDTTILSNDKSLAKSGWGKSKKSEKKFQEQLANMPVPPTFVPPGLNRVHTPPLLDQSEVKDKLADFCFELPGQFDYNRKQQATKTNIPGGIWDSDALLMPIGGIITPPSSSNESGPPSSAQITSTLIERPPELRIITPSYSSPRSSPLAGSAPLSTTQMNFFHMHVDEDVTPDQEMEEKERAKFEWLIPEHLPSSPLCPLHENYRGPSKSICAYHGRRKSGPRGRSTEGSGESPISERPDYEKRRKRRLSSLTGP